MTPAAKRPWFRYSLRTLFVVVTVLACWLGYELNWIRQRREMIAKHQARMEQWQGLEPKDRDLTENVAAVSPAPRSGPGLLWVFGERGVSSLRLLDSSLDEFGHYRSRDEMLARSLFPEATVETFLIDPTLR